MNLSAISGSLRTASLLFILVPLTTFGQATPGQGESAGDDMTAQVEDLPAVLLDSQLTDAKRQLEVLNTLRDMSTALREIRSYRKSLLFLLNPDVPVDERWRLALQSVPIPVAETDPELAGSNLDVQILRQELESLRAEVAILQSVPDNIEPNQLPVVDPVIVDDPPEREEWVISGDSIRYVQFAGDGAESSIWLSSASGGVRILKGQTIRHQGRSVHLVSLQRRPDGRVRINLQVDGIPSTVVR